QLLELSRLEIARVSTLGIAGFDAPASGDAIIEAAAALDGVRKLLAEAGAGYWRDLATARQAVDSSLVGATEYLRTPAEFNDFNRLAFIVRYAAPAARALDALRRASRSPSVRIPRAWRANAASVFEPNAFDTRVYAAATSPAPSPELIAVGRRLFFDSRLS